MKGVYTWAAEKVQSAYSVIMHSYEVCISYLNIVFTPDQRQTAVNHFKDTFFNPTYEEFQKFFLNAPKTKSYIIQSAKIHLPPLIAKFIYAFRVKKVLKQYTEMGFVAEFCLDRTVDAVIFFTWWALVNKRNQAPHLKEASIGEELKHALISTFPRGQISTPESLNVFISNVMISQCLNTVTRAEFTKQLKKEAEAKGEKANLKALYGECGCYVVKTPILAITYYYAEQTFFYMLKNSIPFGAAFVLPFEALSMGRYMMLNNLENRCNPCQRSVLDVNNWSALGIGSKLILPSLITRAALWLLGVDSYYRNAIESSVASFINHLVIVSSIMRKKPYLGDEKEGKHFDPFYPLHACADLLLGLSLKFMCGPLTWVSSYNDKNNILGSLARQSLKINDSLTIQLLNRIFLTRDMQLLNSFLLSEPVERYFAENSTWLIESIDAGKKKISAYKYLSPSQFVEQFHEWSKGSLHQEEELMVYLIYFLFNGSTPQLLDFCDNLIARIRSLQLDDRDPKLTEPAPAPYQSQLSIFNQQRARPEIKPPVVAAKAAPVPEVKREQKPQSPGFFSDYTKQLRAETEVSAAPLFTSD